MYKKRQAPQKSHNTVSPIVKYKASLYSCQCPECGEEADRVIEGNSADYEEVIYCCHCNYDSSLSVTEWEEVLF